MPTMTFDQLSAWAAALPARLEAAVIEAEKQTLKEAKESAQRHSSGGFTTQFLRTLYNPRGPYSRADPHPPADPGEVNEQSGTFHDSWVTEAPSVTAGVVISKLVNTAPYSGYFAEGGSRLMMDRPIVSRILADVEPRRRKRLEKAFREVLTPK